MLLDRWRYGRYGLISSKSEHVSEDVPIPQPEKSSFQRQLRTACAHFWGSFPWILCGILAIILAANLSESYLHGTYERGFDTELAVLNPLLRLVKRRFYGGVQISPNGTYYLSPNPYEPNFLGPSRPEVDEAWDTFLLNKRFIGLTPDEMSQTDFQAKQEDLIFGLYWVEPNGFHSLHCLNLIRKSLDRDYYTDLEDLPPRPFRLSHRLHLDHCVEALRQTLSCSLDTTPVPRPWRPEAGIYHADLDQWHTCRDIHPMRSWMDRRNDWWEDADFVNVSHRFKDPNALYAKYDPW